MNAGIATIIPTRAEHDSPIMRALESVLFQTLKDSLVIIVGDCAGGTEFTKSALQPHLKSSSCVYLSNSRQPGYSGTVNTGLTYLAAVGFSGFVALLDDDDTWDPTHLEANWQAAQGTGADVVVSGLRMNLSGIIQPRKLLSEMTQGDFLVGNPGWQGSNTFVRLATILRIGGFREGMISCNDRDLAIRLLDDPSVSIAYTGEWTANWHFNNSGASLSAKGSPSKRSGLAAFWRLYGSRMSASERTGFFARAKAYFGFDEHEIVEQADSVGTMHLMEEKEVTVGN